jgi:protein SCO1/2
LLVFTSGCADPHTREYELRGQVLRVDPARQDVTIKHEDIPRFMPGMTMSFRVADGRVLEGLQPGDLVRGTLVVRDTDAHLITLERTGFAAVAEPASPAAVSMLSPGDPVADATFVDQTGALRRFSEWKGHPVAVTFMYTRCPVPNFCPLMDRHFRAAQDRIRSNPSLQDVRLLSVSFDPERDTPQTLKQHAAGVQADPSIWQFVTGKSEDIQRFAGQFGLSVMGGVAPGEEIVHNLRTAIVDGDGRLTAILSGSDWTPDQLVTELTKARAGSGASSGGAAASPRQ